jgi:hypothetical protein
VYGELLRWEKENPLSIDVKTLDRMKKHARLVEQGKNAKDIKAVWSPEKGKNSATPGALYKYRNGLYVYKGDMEVDGKLYPDLRIAK